MKGDTRIYECEQETEGYYLEEQVEEEEDNRKIFHTAVRKSDKERFSIHWSPYSSIDQESFRMIVELRLFNCRCIIRGKNDNIHSVNWDRNLVKIEYSKRPLFHNTEVDDNVDKREVC